jgi:hypothetical protein
LVVVAALVGITNYDADGDPCGAATADVMMTMAGERGGEVTARRRRGDGDYKATTRQQGCEGNRLWRRGGNEAIDKRIL